MRRGIVVATFGTLALVAAGCGGDDDTEVAGEGTTTTTTTATEADGAVTVDLADTELGSILVDGAGRTLYVFTNDEPEVSTCTDACAENWPPLEAPEPPVGGEGVDEELLGTITRDDGTDQVAYAGKPLYHFAADAAPGDTNGQGVGDAWFVVGADGEPITTAPPAPEPASGDGYGAGPAAGSEGDREPAGSGAMETAAPSGGAGAARPEDTGSPPASATPAPTTTTAPPATTTTTEAAAATADIRIENFTYSPLALQVSPGTIVTATNADSASHTWTADDGSWESGTLGQGDRYQHTFRDPGTFGYHCAIHPSMKGTVTVS